MAGRTNAQGIGLEGEQAEKLRARRQEGLELRGGWRWDQEATEQPVGA